tara:strand:+ start:3314 stop:4003 length:690 start_codon:yes stop_codon:yes gene_type:complete
MKPLNKLKKFLDEKVGKGHKPSPDNLSECLKEIEKGIVNTLKGRKPSISPSQTNKSVSDMWLILNGRGDEIVNDFSPELRLKMLAGTVLEPLFVLLMKEAGVEFDATQGKTEIKVTDDFTMFGSYDYIIDGEVIDLKTTNMFSYSGKFKNQDTFAENDKYGYLGQAICYAKGAGKPFGGWHVLETNFFNFKELKADQLGYDMECAWDGFVERLSKARKCKTYEEAKELD